jgi:cytoskeletal protein RodZ
MSEPGANARHRHRRKAPPPGSRVKRPLLAIAVLLLVLAPISWILVQQPNSGEADASIPYVTGGDDRYVTTSNEPVAATSSPVPSPSATPTPDDTTATPTPTHSPTPGKTPTRRPTHSPTSVPTDGPTVAPTDQPTRAGSTLKPTPSKTAGPKPTSTPTPSTPVDKGSMSPEELQLFTLIDNARKDKGCAPLQRNTSLTKGARTDAQSRADNGKVFASGSSMAAAGGDDWDAQAAFNRMMDKNSSVILNCGLTTLGVGRGTATHEVGALCPVLFCTTKTRVGWVAGFQ